MGTDNNSLLEFLGNISGYKTSYASFSLERLLRHFATREDIDSVGTTFVAPVKTHDETNLLYNKKDSSQLGVAPLSFETFPDQPYVSQVTISYHDGGKEEVGTSYRGSILVKEAASEVGGVFDKGVGFLSAINKKLSGLGSGSLPNSVVALNSSHTATNYKGCGPDELFFSTDQTEVLLHDTAPEIRELSDLLVFHAKLERPENRQWYAVAGVHTRVKDYSRGDLLISHELN